MLRPSWLEGSVEQVRATEKCGLPSPAVDAEVPRNAERAGLHAYIHLVAWPEPIVIVGIHREPLDFLAFTPTAHEEPPRAAHDSRHIVAAVDDRGVIRQICLRIQSTIHKKRGGQNPRQQDETRVDALQPFEFLA